MTLLNLNSYTLAVKKDMVISKKDLKKMPQMLPHWKPPGKNGLQGYWIKAFKYFQDQPLNFLTLYLQSGKILDWMVWGNALSEAITDPLHVCQTHGKY